ncbi:hypothetical protein JW835_11130 [bacterium]|nr:hypothetical protein [bacterium]
MIQDSYIIIGIHVQDRIHQVPDIQTLFTEYGCSIRTRLGLHETNENKCSGAGLILLEVVGDESQIDSLMNALNQMDGIEVQKMKFRHD